MSQQYPYGDPNDKFKKILFVDTGFGFKQVPARVVEPYTPPTPQPNLKEIKIINGPSHFHQMGISSYKVTMNLLFQTREDYNEYLMTCGWTHKYYDERGHIFVGALESMKPVSYEGHRRYLVEVSLIMIKKDGFDSQHVAKFQDIEGSQYETDISEMADLGLVNVILADGSPTLYFRPADYVTRAEFIFFLNRTRRLLERTLKE